MRDGLERLKALHEEVEGLEKAIIPLLEKFACYKQKGVDDIDDIQVYDDKVEFRCAWSNWGDWGTDRYEVSWDYFDNPDEYIRLDRIKIEEDRKRYDEEYKEHQRQVELETFKRLKEKYEIK